MMLHYLPHEGDRKVRKNAKRHKEPSSEGEKYAQRFFIPSQFVPSREHHVII
jgi:hypothetical protein